MSVLKSDFALLLADKYKEGQLLHARNHGLWSIFATGRRISQQPEIRQNKAALDDIFEQEWNAILKNLQGGAKVDKIGWAYIDNINKTFCGVNEMMPIITAQQYKKIEEMTDSIEKDGLPIKLRDFFVEQLQKSLSCTAQFSLNSEKLPVMDEDAKRRIFSSHHNNLEEKYVQLQNMLTVSYEYTIIEDMI